MMVIFWHSAKFIPAHLVRFYGITMSWFLWWVINACLVENWDLKLVFMLQSLVIPLMNGLVSLAIFGASMVDNLDWNLLLCPSCWWHDWWLVIWCCYVALGLLVMLHAFGEYYLLSFPFFFPPTSLLPPLPFSCPLACIPPFSHLFPSHNPLHAYLPSPTSSLLTFSPFPHPFACIPPFYHPFPTFLSHPLILWHPQFPFEDLWPFLSKNAIPHYSSLITSANWVELLLSRSPS